MDTYNNLLDFMNQTQPPQQNPLQDNSFDFNNQLANLAQTYGGDSAKLYPSTQQPIDQPAQQQQPTQTFRTNQIPSRLSNFIPPNSRTDLVQRGRGTQPQTLGSTPLGPYKPGDSMGSRQYQAPLETGRHDFDGLCQAFVEKVTQGHTGIYPSAIDAWEQQQNKAVQGTNGIRPGDAIYFTPNQSNQGYGHTGIYTGNNQFISATDNGIKTINLTDWQKMTGQRILGYIKS